MNMSKGEALSAPMPAEDTGGLFQTLRERWQNRGDGGWGDQWTPGWKLAIAGMLFVGIAMLRGGGDSGEQTDSSDPSAEQGSGGSVSVEGYTVDAFDVTVAAGDNIIGLVQKECDPGFALQPSIDATKAGNGGSNVIRPTNPAQGIDPLELRCLYPEP